MLRKNRAALRHKKIVYIHPFSAGFHLAEAAHFNGVFGIIKVLVINQLT